MKNKNSKSSISRPIDQLGRIVIPSEWRKLLGWAIGDNIEICRDEDNLILKKAEPITISEIKAVKRFAQEVSNEFIPEDSKVTTLNYVLKTGGKYMFRIKDLFGRVIETTPIFYLKGLPSGTLSGVQDGGVTNKDVTLKYLGGNSLIVYKYIDGVRTEFNDYTLTYQNNNNTYTATILASEETTAEYVFFLYNSNDIGLFVEYIFEIDCILPNISVIDVAGKAIEPNSFTNKPFSIKWDETVTVRYFTSNTSGGSIGSIRYSMGAVLTEDAIYYFEIRDGVGNTAEFSIELHTYIRYEIDGDYSMIGNGKIISKNNLTLRILQPTASFVVVNKDGYTIENGGTLTRDGIYDIYVTDYYGNFLTLNIEIDRVPPEIMLDGVELNGVTNKAVTVRFSDYNKAYLVDVKGNTLRALEADNIFSEHGKYRVMAEDVAGNRSFSEFEIDLFVDYECSIMDHGLAVGEISLVFSEKLSDSAVMFNGERIELLQKFTVPGEYKIRAVDAVGNEVELNFTVLPARATEIEIDLPDTFELNRIELDGNPYAFSFDNTRKILLKNSGVYSIFLTENATAAEKMLKIEIDNVSPTVSIVQEDGGVIVSEPSKQNVTLQLKKDGALINYSLGKKITDAGHYELVVIDDLGNSSVYEFTIKKVMNFWTYILAFVGGAALIAVIFIVVRARTKIKVK